MTERGRGGRDGGAGTGAGAGSFWQRVAFAVVVAAVAANVGLLTADPADPLRAVAASAAVGGLVAGYLLACGVALALSVLHVDRSVLPALPAPAALIRRRRPAGTRRGRPRP